MLPTNVNLFLATLRTSHKNQSLPDCGLSLRSWVFSHSCSVSVSVFSRRFRAVLTTCGGVGLHESLLQRLTLHGEVRNECRERT